MSLSLSLFAFSPSGGSACGALVLLATSESPELRARPVPPVREMPIALSTGYRGGVGSEKRSV